MLVVSSCSYLRSSISGRLSSRNKSAGLSHAPLQALDHYRSDAPFDNGDPDEFDDDATAIAATEVRDWTSTTSPKSLYETELIYFSFIAINDAQVSMNQLAATSSLDLVPI